MLNEKQVSCPYCGELFTAFIDTSQGNHHYVEDCFVCCRPIEFIVTIDGSTIISIETRSGNE